MLNYRLKQVREAFARDLTAGDTVLVPSVVLFELWFGIAKSARQAENTDKLTSWLSGGLDVVPFDADDATVAGRLRATLSARDTPIGSYDLLIAAQALRRNATLVTSNLKEFRRVEGLVIEDWAATAS